MNISDEAVEAAARGMFSAEQCDRRQKLDLEANWQGRLSDEDRDEYRSLARAALEAAAPHLMEQAWENAMLTAESAAASAIAATPNPYRSAGAGE